jgi:TATA-box binding protein (TBP) (component of TFIID and TFIIIB)
MDIENEWENFLVKEDDSIELNNEREETKEKDIDIPKCTPIYISTKTNIAYFNTDVDLKNIFWDIEIMKHDEFRCGIIKKQMKFNSITREEKESIEKMYENENKYKTCDIITHIDTTTSKKDTYKDVRKISIGISKKDVLSYRTKKKSAFYNCFVIILRIWDINDNIFKEVHMKIFNTGKIEVPGIQDDDIFYKSIDYVKNILSKYYNEIEYNKEDVDTVLINSNFSCGYLINRENLYDILVKKYKIQSLYDPCSYPGVQSKYIINDKIEKKQVTLSFMIFRTGSVLIVGKCTKNHIIIVYEFLKELFKNEYNIINQSGLNISKEIEKPKKKRKNRKKTIFRDI